RNSAWSSSNGNGDRQRRRECLTRDLDIGARQVGHWDSFHSNNVKQQGGWLMLKRNFVYGALVATTALAFGAGVALLQSSATAQQDMVDIPLFEVDAMWPKPLPVESLLGMTIGAAVDARDNLWVVHCS